MRSLKVRIFLSQNPSIYANISCIVYLVKFTTPPWERLIWKVCSLKIHSMSFYKWRSFPNLHWFEFSAYQWHLLLIIPDLLLKSFLNQGCCKHQTLLTTRWSSIIHDWDQFLSSLLLNRYLIMDSIYGSP